MIWCVVDYVLLHNPKEIINKHNKVFIGWITVTY